MSKFKLLNENINKVLIKITDNQNLCKLIFYNENTPLEMPNLEKPRDLLFKKIYPYPIAIDSDKEASNYLCIALDDFTRSNSNTGIASNKLVLNVLCHNSLWKLKQGLRPFLILAEIDDMFNDANVIGIGKMQFDKSSLIYAKDYTGYRVTYEVCNYNGR